MCALFHNCERNGLAWTLLEHWEKSGEAGIFPPGWTRGMTRFLSLLSLAVNLPFVLAGGKNVSAGVLARCYVEPSKLGFNCMVVRNCRRITPFVTCLYTWAPRASSLDFCNLTMCARWAAMGQLVHGSHNNSNTCWMSQIIILKLNKNVHVHAGFVAFTLEVKFLQL